jgi:hypothetical protein
VPRIDDDEEMKDTHAITAFEIVGPFLLKVTFDDGVVKEIDFQPELWSGEHRGELWAPLRDLAYFNQVYVDETGTLSWPNGLDFSPLTLYRWPTANLGRKSEPQALTKIVPVRFTREQLRQLKEIARRKGLAPSSLLRSWALEQMAKE